MIHDFSGASAARLFDARFVARHLPHGAICGALDAPGRGETMRFHNDRRRLPLLAQIERYVGPPIKVRYIAKEPGELVIDFLAAT